MRLRESYPIHAAGAGRWLIIMAATALSTHANEFVSQTSPGDAVRIEHVTSPLWTAAQVKQWAIDRSPAARMFDSERSASAAGIDRDDATQCAQAGMKQQVMLELAAHERNRAAADSLELYYRIIGLAEQRLILEEASVVIDRLTSLASEAESLGLSNQDPNELRRKRLTTEDQLARLDNGARKLRLRLAQLTGQPIDITDNAILLDRPPENRTDVSVDDAIATALAERSDLRALRTIQQRLNTNTLPTARQLLAAQQPGLGMVSQTIRRVLLPCLSGPDTSHADLSIRRKQIQQLSEAREDEIEIEVRTAYVDLTTEHTRARLAEERTRLAELSVEKSRAAIELDQAVAGSDLLLKLEQLTAKGEFVQHQIDGAVASVRLRQAQGIAAFADFGK